ncbi:hypothetical protein FACS189429_5560 [Bacteroidia bacterium]|nr:hypothetical protein FACS189429_5560 [Bacteroidia bacterium]
MFNSNTPRQVTANGFKEIFDFDIERDQYVAFLNPQVQIKVRSNAGVPLHFDIDYLRAYRVDDATFDTIYAEFLPNNSRSYEFTANRPEAPGREVQTTHIFDKDNGKTNLLFAQEQMPNRIEYKYSIRVSDRNSDGTVVPLFITPDARINVYAEAKVPFWIGAGSQYVYKDTIDNVGDTIVSQLQKLEEEGLAINSVDLLLKLVNHLPVHSRINMKFLDSSGNEVDLGEILRNIDVPMPTVDAQGSVTAASEHTIKISVPKARIDKLKTVKIIAFDLLFDGGEQTNKMYAHPDDFFRVNIGLAVNGTYTTNLGKEDE